MAQPTNLYDRYDAGTNVREDLIDKITMTSPEETLLISQSGRAEAENTLHEWQRDSLRTPNKDNAAIDGDDATPAAKTPPLRVGNYCQIFQDTIAVSGRANTVKKAGMSSASAYHKAKSFKELQRDMEAAFLSLNNAVIGNGAAAAKTGGLGVLIYTNALHNGAGATAAHTAGAPTTANTAGTNRAFTEALLKTAMQQTFTACGKAPPILMTSPNHKGTFSGFAGIAVNRVQVAKKEQGRIIGAADIYTSDFGDITAVPNYVMAGANYVFGLNTDYIDAVYLRSFRTNALGKTGDSDKEQVLVDATIRATSEVAQFAIKDLTP